MTNDTEERLTKTRAKSVQAGRQRHRYVRIRVSHSILNQQLYLTTYLNNIESSFTIERIRRCCLGT